MHELETRPTNNKQNMFILWIYQGLEGLLAGGLISSFYKANILMTRS